MGFKPKGGKNLFSLCGELNPFLVEKGMLKKKFKAPKPIIKETLPTQATQFMSWMPSSRGFSCFEEAESLYIG